MKWCVSTPENLVSFLQERIEKRPSGKFLRRILEACLCRVNGCVERFGSTKLQRGDWVELADQWEELKREEPFHFPLLYEDGACKIIDKPAGWVCSEANCAKFFGSTHFLVHRLDKETTGALLLAKGRRFRDELMKLFACRDIEKEYWALVDGRLGQDTGIRDTFLAEKQFYQGQTIWGSAPRGIKAITRWKVLARGEQSSLVQCEPVTGRTHQIRVHLAEMKHPILVDRQYAKQFRSRFMSKRPLLHARKLQFVFEGKEIEVIAPIPQDFSLAISTLVPQAHTLL